jgi:tRNA pseudouridine55 synthase
MTTPPSGLVIVDKPAGWTSHDVVARMRRLAGTRKVGHAGTLDPMATGVLVIGVEKATRLLGHLALTEKVYEATIRLGQSTNTDDAEGELTAEACAADVPDEAIHPGIKALTGPIEQIPPQVSAIKVDGKRAYKLARQGEDVELKARPVTVHAFEVRDVRRAGALIDLDATITCSSGTYIRALARDLGADLGVGGHLTALRRTRVGPYDLTAARTLDQLAEAVDKDAPRGEQLKTEILPIADAVAAAFVRRDLTDDEARTVSHGGRIPVTSSPAPDSPAPGQGKGPIALFAPDGTFLALAEEHGPVLKLLAVFV